MPKFYISFGQAHAHRVDGKTYDCDALYLIEAENELAARLEAVETFGRKWSDIYREDAMPGLLQYFHRGALNEKEL